MTSLLVRSGMTGVFLGLSTTCDVATSGSIYNHNQSNVYLVYCPVSSIEIYSQARQHGFNENDVITCVILLLFASGPCSFISVFLYLRHCFV